MTSALVFATSAHLGRGRGVRFDYRIPPVRGARR